MMLSLLVMEDWQKDAGQEEQQQRNGCLVMSSYLKRALACLWCWSRGRCNHNVISESQVGATLSKYFYSGFAYKKYMRLSFCGLELACKHGQRGF